MRSPVAMEVARPGVVAGTPDRARADLLPPAQEQSGAAGIVNASIRRLVECHEAVCEPPGKGKVHAPVNPLRVTVPLVLSTVLSLGSLGSTPACAKALPTDIGSFAKLAEAVTPAVINVNTEIKLSSAPRGDSAPDELFRRFFGGPDHGRDYRERGPRHGIGSGVIIDPTGIALTNAHVVDNASQVEVTVSDGTKYPAKVVGADKKTDLAVLRIDAKGRMFKALPLGDSDRAQVGDWVLAVGSPFGLQATVTSGIISAKARHIGAGPYDDFLQTDAAINPGNSGGPLVNMSGEVVGINTAIVAGGPGIGFAIPSNMARAISGELLAKGSVTRGWLGVALQAVTPDLARSFGKHKGALVSDVMSDSPAAEAGLQAGDIITAVNGKPIEEPSDLARLVGFAQPGTRATLTVWRDGKERPITVTLGKMPDERMASRLGLEVQPVTPDVAQRLGLDPKNGGVVVTNVDDGSPAAEAGLKPGDVVKEIDRQPVKSVADFERLTQRVDHPLALRVQRGDSVMYVALNPADVSAGSADRATRRRPD